MTSNNCKDNNEESFIILWYECNKELIQHLTGHKAGCSLPFCATCARPRCTCNGQTVYRNPAHKNAPFYTNQNIVSKPFLQAWFYRLYRCIIDVPCSAICYSKYCRILHICGMFDMKLKMPCIMGWFYAGTLFDILTVLLKIVSTGCLTWQGKCPAWTTFTWGTKFHDTQKFWQTLISKSVKFLFQNGICSIQSTI